MERSVDENGTSPLQVLKEATKTFTCIDNHLVSFDDSKATDAAKDTTGVVS